MDDNNDVVIETKRLVEAIIDEMAASGRFLDSKDEPDMADLGCKQNCRMLYESEERLRKLLMDSLWMIKRRWNEITGNAILMEDLKSYLTYCRRFREKAWEFDALVHRHSRRADTLFGTTAIGRRYLSDIVNWETEAKAILDYTDGLQTFDERLVDVFKIAVKRLKPFFDHVTARELGRFVMNGVSLKGRPLWTADKRQAIVMGKMLGKSCREMNASFRFETLEGKPTLLSYSGHGPVLDFSQYDIHDIIREMQEAVGR